MELICTVPVARAGRGEEVLATLARLEPVLATVRPIDDEVRLALEAIEAALSGVDDEAAAWAARMQR
jgi:hypothetical protein